MKGKCSRTRAGRFLPSLDARASPAASCPTPTAQVRKLRLRVGHKARRRGLSQACSHQSLQADHGSILPAKVTCMERPLGREPLGGVGLLPSGPCRAGA